MHEQIIHSHAIFCHKAINVYLLRSDGDPQVRPAHGRIHLWKVCARVCGQMTQPPIGPKHEETRRVPVRCRRTESKQETSSYFYGFVVDTTRTNLHAQTRVAIVNTSTFESN